MSAYQISNPTDEKPYKTSYDQHKVAHPTPPKKPLEVLTLNQLKLFLFSCIQSTRHVIPLAKYFFWESAGTLVLLRILRTHAPKHMLARAGILMTNTVIHALAKFRMVQSRQNSCAPQSDREHKYSFMNFEYKNYTKKPYTLVPMRLIMPIIYICF